MKGFFQRLQEPSSWAAIGGILVLAGIEVMPEFWDKIVEAGGAAAWIVAYLLREKGPR